MIETVSPWEVWSLSFYPQLAFFLLCYNKVMNKKQAPWIVAGVVIIIVAVSLGIWWFAAKKAPQQAAPVVTTPPPVVAMHAPKGQVAPGFPKELILDNAAALSDSYAINYSASTNQYTAEWISTSSPLSLYDIYHAYVTKNGWTITNQADGSVLKGIYAKKASAALSVIIMPQAQNKGTKIMVAYVGVAK
jgi:hypothetical protein